MDRENSGSGNIDDILKLLKNTVENTPNTTDIEKSETSHEDDMDTDLLRESLKNKFMSVSDSSDENDNSEKSSDSDEYAIDESFISEATESEDAAVEELEEEIEEELEEEIEEEIEEELEEEIEEELEEEIEEELEEETEKATEAMSDSIVHIAIPWVDSIPDGTLDEDEDEDDEDEPYDEEDEGGFVLFADGNFSDDTHNYDGTEADDEFDEEDEVIADADEDEESETDESDDGEADEYTADNETVSSGSDEDDDVPWYDTPESAYQNQSSDALKDIPDEQFVSEEITAEEQSAFSLDADENAEAELDVDVDADVEQDIPEDDEQEDGEYIISESELYGDEDGRIIEVTVKDDNDSDQDQEKEFYEDSDSDNDSEFEFDGDLISELETQDVYEDLEAIDGIKLSESEDESTVEFEAELSDDTPEAESEVKDSLNRTSRDYDDGESFYRTMVEANELWDKEYAALRFANISEIEEELIENFSSESIDEEACSESEASEGETLSLPEFSDEEYTDTAGSATGEPNVNSDFYGFGETAADPDEDAEFTNNIVESDIEFEEDNTSENIFAILGRSTAWKIISAALLCIFGVGICILEMLPILEIVPNGLLDYSSYPWLYILFDIQLTVFMAAICFGKLKEGLLNIFGRNPKLWSVLSATVVATFLHSLTAIFCVGERLPYLYNSVSAIYMMAAYIFDLLNEKRVENCIDVLGADEDRIFALKYSSGANSCAEKMYQGGIDPDTDIFEPVQVAKKSCEGVFEKERESFDNSFLVSAIVPIAVFAVFVSVISIVLDLGLLTTLNTAIYVFLLLAPLSALVAHFLPLYISYLRLKERGCFIAGYNSAKEISDCDAIVFSDKHLFCECDPRNAGIKLYCEESKTRELFICLAAVYSAVGGPMENTFSAVLQNEKHKVNMIRITRNGFEAVIDGKTNIIVGASEYLARYGINTDGADKRESGIIYAAMNSTLCAKISVAYETQPLFEALSDLLGHYGVKTVIQTYDPIITGKYILKCKKKAKNPISVVHKNVNDYNTHVSEKIVRGRTGAFAISSRLKLVELVVFAKSLAKLTKINSIIRVILYAIGIVLGVITVVSGLAANANMLWILIYHILSISAFIYATIIYLPISFEQIMEKRKKAELKKQQEEAISDNEQD